ncbi:MAG: hypothetical protein GX418_04465 [Clostridiales bacterium]|nr:hypothetical protein [Clostridiales bacterium]
MKELIDIRLPRLMDLNLNEIARIVPEKLSYELTLSEPSTATLVMNRSEAAVTVGQFMELYETYGSLGIFRVENVATTYRPGLWDRLLRAVGLREATVTVTLRHAVCTLEDGMIFGYHEYGGTGVTLSEVLTELIAMQPSPYWQLGTVDYDTRYQYSFENESNLLSAILSTAEPIADEHRWTFDFTTVPWTLGLITESQDDACEMRMNRNAETVKVTVDRTQMVNRIYPLGYGEGVNQLTIADVNGGVKYLEDTASQAAWGVVALPFADTTVTDAATLMAVAQAQLDARREPTVTVAVTGLDLSALTGEALDRLTIGRLCRVPLPEYGVSVRERIVSVRKADVFRDNTRAAITLANRRADAVEQMASTARKAMIGELYSQGATNQYAVHFADNADESHPAELAFYLDENAVHINSVMCRFRLEAFRGYSKGAASGGGGASTTTSESGGYSSGVKYTGNKLDSDTHGASNYTEGPNQTTYTGHKHVDEHVHALTVTTPSHTHGVNVSIPAHTHPPELGILTGGTAGSVTVTVDGNPVPAEAIQNGDFDAVPYLDKDDGGKIVRGTWHEMTITPDANTRIVADLHVKTFIRSISGGNY